MTMRHSVPIRRVLWSALWLAALLPGCGDAAPVEPKATRLLAEDFPSVAVRSDGTGWVAWQGWDGRRDQLDLVPLESLAAGHRKGRRELYTSPTQVLGTALAVDPDDVLHLIWSERVRSDQGGDGWALRGLSVTPPAPRAGAPRAADDDTDSAVAELGTPGPVVTLVPAAGRHALAPVLAADSAGALALAWIELDGAGMCVMAAVRPRGAAWSAPLNVTPGSRSAWAPDLVATGPGRFALAWDGAVDGDYDIVAAAPRRARGGTRAPIRPASSAGGHPAR
jgi:hypothetical protein